MKSRSLFYFTIFLLLIASCEKDEEVLTEDEILKSNLLGTWQMKGDKYEYNIVFLEDDTYIDSVYLVDEGIVRWVFKGKYEIEDKNLTIKDLKPTYTPHDKYSLGVIINPCYTIDLVDDKLSVTFLRIFEPVLNNTPNEIYGIWRDRYILLEYDEDMDPPYESGDFITEIEFVQDENVCYVKYRNVIWDWDNTSVTFTKSYSYNEAGVTYDGKGPYPVCFEDDKMIWEEGVWEYDRVN